MRVDDKLSESLIALTREGGFWRDRLRAYRVRIDGQSAGIIHEYETLEVAVEPGHHEVQLRLDWGTSPKISIEVEEGKIHFLQCRPGSFFGLLIPGIYLDLEPDHPPVQ